MNSLNHNIAIRVNQNVYLKDPESTELGKKIIRFAIDLLDELGYENFNFKKLAIHIESTEASVYRYFESKHKLLAYLTLWYWGWMEYRLVLALVNIDDPKERLQRAVCSITEQITEDESFSQMNAVKLNRLIIAESSKVFLCKNVDADNILGYFAGYKSLVERVSQIILEVKPSYKYPHMIVSTIIEGAHNQRFFAAHLPKLTDRLQNEDAATSFYTGLIQRELGI